MPALSFCLVSPSRPVSCPTCNRPLEVDAAGRPKGRFCSDRCRVIDLGKWLSDSYRIGTPISDEDLDESLPDPRDDA
jgi:uncharacterized protein